MTKKKDEEEVSRVDSPKVIREVPDTAAEHQTSEATAPLTDDHLLVQRRPRTLAERWALEDEERHEER